MTTAIRMPPGAKYILKRLHENGYEAYIVGGCVRDNLLGKVPHDWDVATSATPDEMRKVFRGRPIYDTGIQHGTLTIVSNDFTPYEVTTFRVDGAYSDNRHPDSVAFSKSMAEDMCRRDFTVNALAYNDDIGVQDVSGLGVSDTQNGIIRCVGNPDDRFNEDALRIMRALRFASTYKFTIHEDTAASIHRNAALLKNIAAERIQWELCQMLCGEGVLQVLLDYSDIIATIIPEIQPCIGFEQNNRYHRYTVYDHISHAVANYTGYDVSVKVALLLHDIGKPLCYTEDENGGHFYGHGAPSHDIAEVVLNRLRFDTRTKKEVLELVLYHDSVIEPTTKVVKRWLNKIGKHRLSQLIEVRYADIRAHSEGTQQSRLDRCAAVSAIMDEIIEQQSCFSIKDLRINGNDVMSIGVPQGKRVGEILIRLLDGVIAGEIENDHDSLIEEAKRLV